MPRSASSGTATAPGRSSGAFGAGRKSPSEMAEIDINGVIENILGPMRVELTRHDVSVETELRNGLATIMGIGSSCSRS